LLRAPYGSRSSKNIHKNDSVCRADGTLGFAGTGDDPADVGGFAGDHDTSITPLFQQLSGTLFVVAASISSAT
jgi:hypothetical protein